MSRLNKTNVELRKRLSRLNKTNVEVEKRMSWLNEKNAELEKRRWSVKTTIKLSFDRKNVPYLSAQYKCFTVLTISRRELTLNFKRTKANFNSISICYCHVNLSEQVYYILCYGTIFVFLEETAPPWRNIPAQIHEHVVGSRVDVVTLCDQMVRIARFSCGFFTAMAVNKAGNKYHGSSM